LKANDVSECSIWKQAVAYESGMNGIVEGGNINVGSDEIIDGSIDTIDDRSEIHVGSGNIIVGGSGINVADIEPTKESPLYELLADIELESGINIQRESQLRPTCLTTRRPCW